MSTTKKTQKTNRNIRRRCPVCGIRKQRNATYWHRNKSRPDGLRDDACKECRNKKTRPARNKAYHANIEKEKKARRYRYLKKLTEQGEDNGEENDD